MREDHTPAVERALAAAAVWATRLQRTSDPLTLALALLEDDDGRPAELLRAAGITVELVRTRFAVVPPERDAGSLAEVFALAADIARDTAGERTIRSEHAFMAVVQSSPLVRSELEAAGWNPSRWESRMQAEPAILAVDDPLEVTDSTDRMDAVRVLDAAANRAREALRVVEDYCRFVLDDALLSREAKFLRHELRDTLDRVGPLPLLEARDTLGDVGTSIGAANESRRDSPHDVALANLKRLQEALRSMEEFGKVVGVDLGSALEKLRYRAYTFERVVVLRHSSRQRLADARLYLLLTASTCATSVEYAIGEAAAGGVNVIQLREKGLNDREFLDRALQVRQWTRRAGVLFVVNDRPDVARLADADGVHLGQNDFSIREARRIVGPDLLIGVSTHSIEQLQRAVFEGANYLGVGPVFPSRTKSFDELPGLEFVGQASSETSLPAFALGGITADNLTQVLEAGASRVAVSSAIGASDEPRRAALALRRQLDAQVRG